MQKLFLGLYVFPSPLDVYLNRSVERSKHNMISAS